MANPQPTDAHLRIAHSIEEEIMMRCFTKRQRAILDLILRLSWGCCKKTAIIPRQKDFGIVGIGESKIKDELEWLVNARVVFWDKSINEYAFNKDYDEWRVSIVSGYDRDRFNELLSLNIKTSQNGKKLAEKGSRDNEELPEKGSLDFPKREVDLSSNAPDISVSDMPKESIKESTTYNSISIIDNTRTNDSKIIFSNNVLLTPDEYQRLIQKSKLPKTTHYIARLSKQKTSGLSPPGSDYEAILKMMNEEIEHLDGRE